MQFDISLLLEKLSDAELSALGVFVSQEERRRAYYKFDKGEFDALDQSEKDLIAKSKKIQAVKNYKDRTNQSLYLCKLVVDHYLDLGSECDCAVGDLATQHS